MKNNYLGKQDEKKKLKWLQNVIAEIETENLDIKSPHVNYSLRFLEIECCQLTNDYAGARSACTDWLNIVRNNKSVYRRQRIGIVYNNLSRCDYYLGNFEQAAEWAQEAQKYFPLNSENYCISLEQEFYALFATRQYGLSTDIAKKMISGATRKELGEFRYSKYNYLHSNALFMQRKLDAALDILAEEREISTDKAGWEIGARILNVMTLIEMLKFDLASKVIISLKRFFIRTDKITPVSQRDKTILNLLLILERAGFMFSSLNGSTEKHLVTLHSLDEKYRWEPFTPELIPFHEWFAGKMKKKIEAVGQPAEKKKGAKVSVSHN
jgi:tetratricopeptide (TPR) repeat protein